MFPANTCTNALQIRFILQAAKYFNLSTKDLLSSANVIIDNHCLPSAPIPVEVAIRLWQAAEQLSRDPLIALKSGTMTQTYQQSPLFGLVCATKNMMKACKYIIRYQKNNLGMVNHRMGFEGNKVIGELVTPAHHDEELRPLIERQASVMLSFFKVIFSPEVQKNAMPEIYFKHQPNGPVEHYEKILGVKVHFGHSKNLFVAPRHLMDMNNPLHNPEMEEALLSLTQRHDRGITEGTNLIVQIEEFILKNLNNRYLNIDFVATSYAIGPRTLQRRLKEQNTSFNVLLNNVRYNRAMQLIVDPDISISEIATDLGFQNQSALNQAFTRWTNITPRQYRDACIDNPVTQYAFN